MKKNDGKWWEGAIFYTLYVDKFAGNFQSLESKLYYFERLGVTCIHILPFYISPMVDDGFDVSDYFSIRPELGTLEDFSRFVKSARNLGIDVMVDFVFNHTSTEHPWFLGASTDRANPRRDFYIWSDAGEELKRSENAFPDIKQDVWIKNPSLGDYYFSTFYTEQADLNWRNPEVFSEMMKVIDFWAGFGIRAFRLDAASHLIKKEGTDSIGLSETHNVLKHIRTYIDSKWDDITLLAEACHEQPPKQSSAYFGAGDECSLVYLFPLADELFFALIHNDEKRLWEMSEKSSQIPLNCRWLGFLRNHDDLSLGTLLPEDKEKVLRALDPNRVLRWGEGVSARLATAFHNDPAKIKKAFELLFEICKKHLIRPIIYYGDEIGMENEPIPPSEKDTRRAVRGKFDWREASRQISDPSSLFSFIAKLAKEAKQKSC